MEPRGLFPGFLEGGGGQVFEREVEHVTVGAEALERPGEIGLRGDAQGAASGDDAEEHAGEKTARAYYDARGWVAFLLGNPWGYTSPGESASWGSTVS